MSKIIKWAQGGDYNIYSSGSSEALTGKTKKDFVSYLTLLQPLNTDILLSSGPLEELTAERERVKQEAEEIRKHAESEAAKIREDAYREAFEKGEKDGESAGREKYDEAIQRVEGLLREIQDQREGLNKEYEKDLLPLIKSMVDRLVNHEVSINPLVIQACLRKAMGFVVENSAVKVHLHPDDFNRIKEAGLEDPALLEGKSRVQLIEDPNITMGGCFLESDFGEIDASLDSYRERLYAAIDKEFLAALAESG